MSTLAHSLAFAGRNLATFPVHYPVGGEDEPLVCSCGRLCEKPAKHPHTLAKNGVYSATTDSGILKHWFGYLVPEANLGVHCAGLVVIDVDPRHGGDETFAALERERELPPTWRVISGSGGQHIYFAAPDGASIKNYSYKAGQPPGPLGVGIDIRTRGGYVVAPPSRHMSGRRYEWSVDHHPQATPLAPLPEWLIARLTAPAAEDAHEPLPPTEWVKRLKPASEYPDDAACAIAGHFFAYGHPYQVVLGIMRPWARESGLDQQELENIVARISRNETSKRKKRLER